tara:strand:- start:451 stop:639 length:189 start_codon:yes stop_codon:yes gene_type:complete
MTREVNNTSNKLVLIPRFVDANTLGIIKNIMNGFFIPPVKKIKKPNCIISINKNNKADLSDS